MRKIYVVGSDNEYANWMQGSITKDLEKADLVVFTGGEDVNPALYSRRPHFTTRWNSLRDSRELKVFKIAQKLNKKIIGICRGSQLFCVLAGGILVQDSHHLPNHYMKTEGKEILVTSSHHQRQYPWVSQTKTPVNFKLIGWTEKMSPYNFGESDEDRLSIQPEVEMAIYPDINALAIQSHPEWAYPARNSREKEYITFVRKTLNEFMENNYVAKAA